MLFPHCLLLSLNATAVNQPPHLPPSYLRDSSNEVCVGIMAQKAACETVSYKGIHYPIHVCAKRKQRPVETLFKQFISYKQCFSVAAAKQQEKALLCTSSEPFCHLSTCLTLFPHTNSFGCYSPQLWVCFQSLVANLHTSMVFLPFGTLSHLRFAVPHHWPLLRNSPF